MLLSPSAVLLHHVGSPTFGGPFCKVPYFLGTQMGTSCLATREHSFAVGGLGGGGGDGGLHVLKQALDSSMVRYELASLA